MNRILTSPEYVPFDNIIHSDYKTIFLAGSIEMGIAENWQEIAIQELLQNENIIILNPRRKEWDSSWIQRMSNPQFNEQVLWELNGQDNCDKILMHFDKNTKSPITLLELGLYASSGKLVISCPDDFYRKGNVEIVALRYGIPLFDNLEDSINYIKMTL